MNLKNVHRRFLFLPYFILICWLDLSILMKVQLSMVLVTQSPLEVHSKLNKICLGGASVRSEEHTSELHSHLNLVCRLLLEKKKITRILLLNERLLLTLFDQLLVATAGYAIRYLGHSLPNTIVHATPCHQTAPDHYTRRAST